MSPDRRRCTVPRSADTLEALQNVLDFFGLKSNGPFFDLLLELEEAAWTAGYEAAKSGYERIIPS